MKWRAGKYPFSGSRYLDFLEDENVKLLGISWEHVKAVETLNIHHKDPFDHLILAQAKVEEARLLTSDREMTLYGVPCIPTMR